MWNDMEEPPVLEDVGQETLHLPRGGQVIVPKVGENRFGEMYAPRNLTELLALLETDTFGTTVRAWRGQASLSWTVDSTATRRVRNSEDWDHEWANFVQDYSAGYRPEYLGSPQEAERSFSNDMVRGHDEQLLDKARLQGYGYQSGRRLGDLELLALLRHHGAATRLVDFTSIYLSRCGSPLQKGSRIGA